VFDSDTERRAVGVPASDRLVDEDSAVGCDPQGHPLGDAPEGSLEGVLDRPCLLLRDRRIEVRLEGEHVDALPDQPASGDRDTQVVVDRDLTPDRFLVDDMDSVVADAAPLPVEIRETPTEDRYAAPVETAIYLVAAEAIEDAGARDASHVTLNLGREDDRLVLDAADDGAARTSLMVHLADRVGARGGSLEVAPTWVRAEVPFV
jgi:hypothetical protein